MKDIPFYITPEEFDVHEQAFIQQLKEARPQEYWSCPNSPNASRYYMLILSIIIGTICGLIPSTLVFLIPHNDELISKSPIFFILLGVLVSYLTMGVDNLYHYHLSDKGLLMEYHQHIPKFAYSILRGIAWIGCIVSVMAMAKFGAAAFAGAGGSLLLAFGLTRMKQDVFSDIVLPSYVHSITYNRTRCAIRAFYFRQGCRYENDPTEAKIRRYLGGEGDDYIFCNSEEQLEQVIFKLESVYGTAKAVEVKDEKLFFTNDRPEGFDGYTKPFEVFQKSELPNLVGKPAPKPSLIRE